MKNRRKKYLLGFAIAAGIAIYISFGIYHENKKNNEYKKSCQTSEIIHPKNEYLTLWFISKYETVARKGITVSLIRDGKTIQNISCKQSSNDNAIDLLDLPQMKAKDSLKIVFKNQQYVFVHGFKNGLDYGGEKIIGCVLNEYYENNKKKFVSDGSSLTID